MCLLKGESSCPEKYSLEKKSQLYRSTIFIEGVSVWQTSKTLEIFCNLETTFFWRSTWYQSWFFYSNFIGCAWLESQMCDFRIRIQVTHFKIDQSSLAPLTMILAQCLWPGECQEVHRKMAEKKYQMLTSIELSEINFNQLTEKGNFRLLVTG